MTVLLPAVSCQASPTAADPPMAIRVVVPVAVTAASRVTTAVGVPEPVMTRSAVNRAVPVMDKVVPL